MNKPLVIQLEDRKRELADTAMNLPMDSLDKYNRLVGEYAGINYVIELINSIEEDRD